MRASFLAAGGVEAVAKLVTLMLKQVLPIGCT